MQWNCVCHSSWSFDGKVCILADTRQTGFYQSWVSKKKGDSWCDRCCDGSHIPIALLKRLHTSDYYNRKKFHSIILQEIVDEKGLFRDLYVGWPGSVGDAHVWRNSPIFHKALRECIETKQVTERVVFYNGNFLLGDKAYSLSEFLLPPYKRTDVTPVDQKLYN